MVSRHLHSICIPVIWSAIVEGIVFYSHSLDQSSCLKLRNMPLNEGSTESRHRICREGCLTASFSCHTTALRASIQSFRCSLSFILQHLWTKLCKDRTMQSQAQTEQILYLGVAVLQSLHSQNSL